MLLATDKTAFSEVLAELDKYESDKSIPIEVMASC